MKKIDNNEKNLDQEILFLQKEINIVVNERKNLVKETEILKRRINLIKNQDNEMKSKCTLQLKKLEDRIEKKKHFFKESKMKFEHKVKQEEEIKNKRNKIYQNKHKKSSSDTNLEINDTHKILEEKKNKIKQVILQKLQNENNKNN